MSESKFLKFQDRDNDGLIDVCDDELIETEVPCKGPCTPNPSAIVPNWKMRTIEEPFLNEKKCLYQVTKVTPYTSTAPGAVIGSGNSYEINQALEARFLQFKEQAIQSILDFYEKDDSDESKSIVYAAMVNEKFDLDARPHSRLKLLYSVPFDTIYDLPPAAPESEEEQEEPPGVVKVRLNAGQATNHIIRVRKGLNLYGRLLKVYRGLGEGNCYFVNDRTVFNLEDYGDDALFGSGILSRMWNAFESFLDAKGFRLPGEFFGVFSSDERITKFEFVFDNYRLVKLKLWTIECGNKPHIFGKRKLRPLNAQGGWKDRTACAYMANLSSMSAQLNARVQIPWQKFIEQYTYPKVFFDIKEENVRPTIGSCLTEALADEFKELGQDIMDEVFGIGDALAYQFRKSICRDSIQDSLADDLLIGTYPGEVPADITKMFGLAQEQAFMKLAKDDNVFVVLCAAVFASTTKFGPAKAALERIHRFGLQRIKVCGLFDLLVDVIQCLTGGLTLDEALRSLVNSALGNMSIELFGVLFQDLPADRRAALEAQVRQALEEGGGIVGEIPKPWEVQQIIDAEREQLTQDNFEGTVPPPDYKPPTEGKYERTIVEQYDSGISELQNMDVDNVMQVYVKAIIELYSDNLLELIDELNKFPGAQIVTSIIALLDCPHPPLLNPGFDDFIKSLVFPFCRNMQEFSIDRIVFENPLQYLPTFTDITKAIWDAAKLVITYLIFQIIMLVMMKICEIIGNAICGALELTGDIVTALPAAMAGKKNLTDVIRESICGPEVSDKKVEDTLVDMMSQLGLGAAAFANKGDTVQFGLDLSAATTERELTEALLGQPSAAFLEIVDQLVEFEYPQFRDALPNRTSIGRLFANIGNITPVNYKAQLEDFLSQPPDNELTPANPSMCANPEQIQRFRELRCEILEGRASPEQCHEMFCDMREDMLEDLKDLGDILHGGLSNHVKKNLPPLVGEPGCDDGIFPYESPQQTAVATQVLKGNLDMLKMDYATDMLGNGNFWNTDASWGFMNMVLSDTNGNPLTAHHRKAYNNKEYVNFATNLANGGESTSGFFSIFQSSQGFSGQIGQFPYYVGEWMRRQFLNAGYHTPEFDKAEIKPGFFGLRDVGMDLYKSMENGFVSRNSSTGGRDFRIDFEELQYNNLFGSLTQGVNLFMVPDFGYNVSLRVDNSAEQVVVTREVRKGNGVGVRADGEAGSGRHVETAERVGCDILLDFRDNSAGMRKPPTRYVGSDKVWASSFGFGETPGSHLDEWSYGFELHCYYSDIHVDDEGRTINRPDDNVRIDLIEKVNFGADYLGPLGKNLEDQMTKIEPFDLPNWIESIPIVGWAIEGVINLILLPFTQIIARNIHRALLRASEKVMRVREFEFLSVDDGLDVFNAVSDDPNQPKITDYPNYAKSRLGLQTHAPPVLLLSDMLGITPAAAKNEYDQTTTALYRRMCREIGDVDREKLENSMGGKPLMYPGTGGGWLYGADYDFLTPSDIEYGIERNGRFVPYYSTALEEEDMVLGMSRDQYNAMKDPNRKADDARVIYLDPGLFGGSYSSPNLYIKPLKYTGWMGFVQVFFPEYTPCKPHSQDVVDFDEINQMIMKYFPNLAEDPRLSLDPECVRETPFNRIMNRAAKMGMYSLVIASVRIYAATHIFKTLGTFAKIMPKFPDNFSSIYSAYIVERMEEDFKNAQGWFAEAFNSFKDDEFWYGFLEQSVECYDFLVENGEIIPPPQGGYLQGAFDTINDLQTSYAFPYRQTTRRTFTDGDGNKVRQVVLGLWDAKMAGEAGFFQSLKGYRSDEAFEGVQSVEEEAKLILQQLVNYELTKMGTRMVENMRQYGFNPTIFDLDYFIFTELSQGGEGLYFVGPEKVEQVIGLPDPSDENFPGPYYTSGGEFRVAIDKDDANEFGYGDEYIGYYHGHIDDDGDVVYMQGEYHTNEPHDVLTPIDDLIQVGTQGYFTKRQDVENPHAGIPEGITDAEEYRQARQSQSSPYPQINQTFVPLGDVARLNSAPAGSADKPFGIEKYVSINGTKYSPENAKAIIMRNDPMLRISDVYPGTLRLVYNAQGRAIGLDGHLGVRYGLNFYYGGSKKLITSVEVDALDLRINQFNDQLANSKLLYCLLENLKNDPKYKLLTNYIFSLKKINGILAIYNDFGFLSSIGEVTPGMGDHTAWLPTGFGGQLLGILFGIKAGNVTEKSHWLNDSEFPQVRVKPGSRAYIHRTERVEEYPNEGAASFLQLMFPFLPNYDDPIEVTVVETDLNKSGTTGNEGWQHYDDRQPGFFGGLWVCEWDSWDRKLLRNSKSRIKRLFKTYYYSRDFQPGDDLLGPDEDPAKLWIKNLKTRMFPTPGSGMLPWWSRGKLKSNPYNAKGELCTSKN